MRDPLFSNYKSWYSRYSSSRSRARACTNAPSVTLADRVTAINYDTKRDLITPKRESHTSHTMNFALTSLPNVSILIKPVLLYPCCNVNVRPRRSEATERGSGFADHVTVNKLRYRTGFYLCHHIYSHIRVTCLPS